MNIILLTLPMALLLGGGFIYAFVKVAMSGQYDDLETPAHRMLFDDEGGANSESNQKTQQLEPKTVSDVESQKRPRKETQQ